MRFRFNTSRLRQLYTTESGAEKYPPEVVSAFFDVMSSIKAAPDERDLYALKSLHFEKLSGKRGKTGERSLRLNKRWRLIVKLEKDDQGKLIVVIEISDHYND